jgi:hypothetical protein
MKLVKTIILITFLASVSSLSVSAEPSRWERIKGYAHTEKEAAVADGKKVLAELDVKIDDMKKQAAQAKGETKEAYERNLADLKVKRDEAEKQMEHMQKSGGEAWHATRDGFAGAYQSLHQAYEKAAASITR